MSLTLMQAHIWGWLSSTRGQHCFFHGWVIHMVKPHERAMAQCLMIHRASNHPRRGMLRRSLQASSYSHLQGVPSKLPPNHSWLAAKSAHLVMLLTLAMLGVLRGIPAGTS